MSACKQPARRGTVAVAMLVALILLQVVIAGMVLTGARDQDLMERRVETARALYAAEAGMNMAIREVMQNADEDGDGAIGSISDDGNAVNDPDLSGGRVVVSRAEDGGMITLTSTGRCGESVRSIKATLQ
jgi:Tfp pilus assembly protein PilX